ncbi:methyl-accepting chemotaxis protein [Arcobacter roscoffensis]|uniref:Methyl-accepting chemotaxis protein n=1 Tax=Arcobacter roscoffensis TaxID=2961520 RepID=A0ABY5E815_9BACT|nr:methyl-accepting chemotaxis protein [Arcobacter roscoffensis]UTJ07203.1 methyl-accepting chemotaxis protein [Arcobacter roscoffensis]
MKKASISFKLMSLIVGSLLILSIIMLSISITESIRHSEEEKLAQLKSITEAKKQHVSSYFKNIAGLITSTANSASTQDAMKEFIKGFYTMNAQSGGEINMADVKKEISSHYDNLYIKDINFNLPNIQSKRSTSEYLPKNANGILAQYMFIVKNEEKIGEKNKLTQSNLFFNNYAFAHIRYHETFNEILKKFSLADIFLVDVQGNIVYSTFKEKDFGTNLKNGPYSNSSIAKINEKAYSLKKGETAFSDFKPYEPSYNSPASFIAAPIFNNQNTRVGNLIIQIPTKVIDGIMNFDGKYKEAGLGESGNSFLIASDYKMRNNHRHLKTFDAEYVKKSGTTIGLYEIKNEAISKALKNESGGILLENNEGKKILSAYSGLKVFGQQWGVISQIDEEEALQDIVKINIILASISFVVLLVIIFISVLLLRNSIIKPLKNFEEGLMSFFKYLNNEINEVKHLDDSKEDEIGQMSKVVNKNINKTKDIIEKDRELINETVSILSEFEKGDLSKRINTVSLNPSLNELKNVLNKMGENLEANIQNILAVLEEYTNYNYLNRVDNSALKEQLLQLAQGVNSLGDATTQMLLENKTNGMKLDSSSDILLTSVEILSNNTNDAAASIEQTSAALEEINSNLISNSQNVQKMSTNAQELTQSVKQGEELAQKTTVAMDEINEQVSSINDAITVIDQIAFQTNILSLNAAVEAATAGEAGKGFAVVAQEVRNLASRSAEAAKEIKELVENANIKANEGKAIADSMIGGYTGLSTNINSTIELIESVSISSSEQQQGISQITETVARLDKQTQENASIAQNTNDIAQETDVISKAIVSDTNNKEFKGKDSIKIEAKDRNTVTLENRSISTKIEQNINEENKWESF